jgi:DNA-binding PadR family transcriptional regulator
MPRRPGQPVFAIEVPLREVPLREVPLREVPLREVPLREEAPPEEAPPEEAPPEESTALVVFGTNQTPSAMYSAPRLTRPATSAILSMQYRVWRHSLSVRHSLLALLWSGPMHGYGLKTEFEAATADIWPLNVGQVYTTLGRLERDGLVTAAADADGQKEYRITEAGRAELARWFETPVPREVIPRQELAIKLVFALRSGMADVAEVVQRQRVATVQALQDITRLKAEAESGGDLAGLLMLDALVFQAEAEARWLDLCEARLARRDAERSAEQAGQRERPAEQVRQRERPAEPAGQREQSAEQAGPAVRPAERSSR